MRYNLALAVAVVLGLAVPCLAQDYAAPPVRLNVTGETCVVSGNTITAVCGTGCTFWVYGPPMSYYALVACPGPDYNMDCSFVFWEGVIPLGGEVGVDSLIPVYMANCKLEIAAVVISPEDNYFWWTNSFIVRLL